ncbi:MAG TPA: hypothetical protein VJU79_10465, partial [Candidatus Dormibacteraeota bacterium]|nr:hypothetical protein [Candidatus Dormibacteraeota bacterium]
DPTVLWLKAQILRGADGMERVSKPMTVAQLVAYLAVAAGWTGLLTWRWEAIIRWFENLNPAQALANSAAGSASLSMTFFLCVLVLSSVTIVVAMHTILAEE